MDIWLPIQIPADGQKQGSLEIARIGHVPGLIVQPFFQIFKVYFIYQLAYLCSSFLMNISNLFCIIWPHLEVWQHFLIKHLKKRMVYKLTERIMKVCYRVESISRMKTNHLTLGLEENPFHLEISLVIMYQ